MEHNGRSRSFPSRQKRRLRAFGSAFKVFIAPLNKLSWLWLEVQTLSRPTSSRMAFLNSLHPKSLHFMEQHVECKTRLLDNQLFGKFRALKWLRMIMTIQQRRRTPRGLLLSSCFEFRRLWPWLNRIFHISNAFRSLKILSCWVPTWWTQNLLEKTLFNVFRNLWSRWWWFSSKISCDLIPKPKDRWWFTRPRWFLHELSCPVLVEYTDVQFHSFQLT